MQLSHTRPVGAVVFDDPNLVSAAGLVPLVTLAQRAGLTTVAQDRLTVPTDKGANAGLKGDVSLRHAPPRPATNLHTLSVGTQIDPNPPAR
jgi:hypothetical protein